MTRRKKIDKTERIEIRLPGTVFLRLKTELYSEVEGKVPFGAMSELGTLLFSDWLRARGCVVMTLVPRCIVCDSLTTAGGQCRNEKCKELDDPFAGYVRQGDKK